MFDSSIVLKFLINYNIYIRSLIFQTIIVHTFFYLHMYSKEREIQINRIN